MLRHFRIATPRPHRSPRYTFPPRSARANPLATESSFPFKGIELKGGGYARLEARDDHAATNVLSPSLHNAVSLRIHVSRLWFAKHALCKWKGRGSWGGTWAMLLRCKLRGEAKNSRKSIKIYNGNYKIPKYWNQNYFTYLYQRF